MATRYWILRQRGHGPVRASQYMDNASEEDARRLCDQLEMSDDEGVV